MKDEMGNAPICRAFQNNRWRCLVRSPAAPMMNDE